jgi:anti-sigma factor RsiW
MRDNHSDSAADLDTRALLYVGGEMNPTEASAFERLLGEDQRAREALVLAVELARMLDGSSTPTPNPTYRAEVRRRLLPLGVCSWLITGRRYRGHPAAWAALGGVAALLAVTLLTHGFSSSGLTQPEQAQVKPTLPSVAAVQPNLDETALFWSEIPKHERMNRLLEEEHRRKSRSEDVRLARGEEQPNRLTASPMP